MAELVQCNPCRTIVKFPTKNPCGEHKTIPESIFEGNSKNKMNLEGKKKIKIEFHKYGKI